MRRHLRVFERLVRRPAPVTWPTGHDGHMGCEPGCDAHAYCKAARHARQGHFALIAITPGSLLVAGRRLTPAHHDAATSDSSVLRAAFAFGALNQAQKTIAEREP